MISIMISAAGERAVFLIITVFISTHGWTRNQTFMRLVREIFRFPCIFDAIKRVTRFLEVLGSGGRNHDDTYLHIRTAGSGTVRMYRRKRYVAQVC
jgi:hypothetical protein